MSICVIQTVEDFENKYAEYSLKLGKEKSKHTLSLLEHTKLSVSKDLELVNERLSSLAEVIQPLYKIAEENDFVLGRLQGTFETIAPILKSAQRSVAVLNDAGVFKSFQEQTQRMSELAETIRNSVQMTQIYEQEPTTTISQEERELLFMSPKTIERAVVNEKLDEVIDAIKALGGGKAEQKNQKFPFRIKAGTTWESVAFQFLDKERVKIVLGTKSHETNYADMGFMDARSEKPNMQWGFLLVLAKNKGRIEPSSPDAQERFKKQKELLTKRLQNYFSIEYDPFKPYDGGYEIKLTLIYPEQEEISTGEKSEIDQMFDELMMG